VPHFETMGGWLGPHAGIDRRHCDSGCPRNQLFHFWLLFIGVNTALVPQVLLASGLAGRVARIHLLFLGKRLVV